MTRETDPEHPESKTSGSGFDDAQWTRLSELLDESSCLFDEQALCALRDMDPRTPLFSWRTSTPSATASDALRHMSSRLPQNPCKGICAAS